MSYFRPCKYQAFHFYELKAMVFIFIRMLTLNIGFVRSHLPPPDMSLLQCFSKGGETTKRPASELPGTLPGSSQPHSHSCKI